MSEKEAKTEATKNTVIVISAILHLVTIIAVVLLYFQDEPNPDEYAQKEHTHYEYADDSHSHTADEITYKIVDLGKTGTLQRAIFELKYISDDSHSHSEYADDSHSHSADEITYKSFGGFGKRGTIESALRTLER